jgi:hypothetical protein
MPRKKYDCSVNILKSYYNEKLLNTLDKMEILREEYNENSNDAGVDAVTKCMAMLEAILP